MLQKIAFMISVFLVVSTLYGNDTKKVAVQLLWKHQFEFAGYYMAKEKGFYNDIGLDVEIKEFDFGVDISKDVSDGKVEFGVGSSSLILDAINGRDLYLLLPVLQNSPFVLISKEKNQFKTVSDLKGKKIMLTQNQVSMAALNAMFKVNQLNKKDFIEVEHSFNINDLVDDRVDAISVYLSNEPYELIEKGIKYTIFDPKNDGFNFYEDILFTSKKLESQNPKMVKDFYEATKKGWEYAFTHIDESVAVIEKKYNSQNKTTKHLKYEAEQLKKMSLFGEDIFGKFKPDVIHQIVQTYNLLDLSKKGIDTEKILYPDAIYTQSKIDFVLLLKILFGVSILLGGFYYWNRKLSLLNKKIQENQKKVTLLLNNAGQGFLTFKRDFLIDSEYSKECEKLLGEDISSKDIAQLLFQEDKKRDFFKSTLQSAMDEREKLKRNAYLSLVPNLIIVNQKALKIEYKIVENTIFMLILTNVTTQKKLENKIKKEQEIFKMIVAIASESGMFYDLVAEYETFLDEQAKYTQIDLLYRKIHTFKGIFSQLYIQEVVTALHDVETKLSSLLENENYSEGEILEILRSSSIEISYFKIKKIIEDILGKEFLQSHNFVKIELTNIIGLQNKIATILQGEEMATPECQEILCTIQNLSKQPLITLLKPYSTMITQLAQRFEKELDQFIVEGDEEILVGEEMKPFLKSLGHVFRNSIDHGIETPERRLEKNKDEQGTIICQFQQTKSHLYIFIADDGAGIDVEKLKQKAIELKMDPLNMSNEELFSLIFLKNFSTKEDISEISGRGVGMGAVKSELEKLNGIVNITSKKDKGATFEFIIPLTNKI